MKFSWTFFVGIFSLQAIQSSGAAIKRWIPDRLSDDDYGMEMKQGQYQDSSVSQSPFHQSYLQYYWPDMQNSQYNMRGTGDSGMMFRANDPVQQLNNVHEYALQNSPYIMPFRTDTRTNVDEAQVASRSLISLLGGTQTHHNAAAVQAFSSPMLVMNPQFQQSFEQTGTPTRILLVQVPAGTFMSATSSFPSTIQSPGVFKVQDGQGQVRLVQTSDLPAFFNLGVDPNPQSGQEVVSFGQLTSGSNALASPNSQEIKMIALNQGASKFVQTTNSNPFIQLHLGGKDSPLQASPKDSNLEVSALPPPAASLTSDDNDVNILRIGPSEFATNSAPNNPLVLVNLVSSPQQETPHDLNQSSDLNSQADDKSVTLGLGDDSGLLGHLLGIDESKSATNAAHNPLILVNLASSPQQETPHDLNQSSNLNSQADDESVTLSLGDDSGLLGHLLGIDESKSATNFAHSNNPLIRVNSPQQASHHDSIVILNARSGPSLNSDEIVHDPEVLKDQSDINSEQIENSQPNVNSRAYSSGQPKINYEGLTSSPLDIVYPGVNSANPSNPSTSSLYYPFQYNQPSAQYIQPSMRGAYTASSLYPQYSLPYSPVNSYGSVVQPSQYGTQYLTSAGGYTGYPMQTYGTPATYGNSYYGQQRTVRSPVPIVAAPTYPFVNYIYGAQQAPNMLNF